MLSQLQLGWHALRRRAVHSIYMPFADPVQEEEYRELALSSHRSFLFSAFVAYGFALVLLVIFEAAGVTSKSKEKNGVTYTLQALVALAAFGAGAAMRHEELLRPRSATAVALVVLALAGLMPTILDRERGNLNESGQLMVVYLLAYSVCVPAFNTHLVTGGMSLVCVLQLLLCLTSTAVAENRVNLTLRELFKGVVINAIGARIASAGER
eukprot:2964774-Prymnesium_polylepis.1